MSSSAFASAGYTVGQLNALIKLLKHQGGEDGPEKFLRGDLVIGVPKRHFETWMNIKIGNRLSTPDLLRKALEKDNFLMGFEADLMLGGRSFMVSCEPTDVDLVRVTSAELGFKNGASYGEIIHRAEVLGLCLNISEIAPQLRLQYPAQVKGERLIVAMLPLSGSGGQPRILSVECLDQDGRWLSAVNGDPGYLWGPKTIFVFQRRR